MKGVQETPPSTVEKRRDRPRRPVAVSAECAVSHNLNGQRLGPKGRVTRERIIAAAVELLADPQDAPISLSAVARKASLGMTSLYLYFNDLSELLLAVLDPIMETAEEAYLAMLRDRWPEDELSSYCVEFVAAYQEFWQKHSRILHLRNSMGDRGDERMMEHRINSTQPIIRLLTSQMDMDSSDIQSDEYGLATVLMIGIERAVTVATDMELPSLMVPRSPDAVTRFVKPGARMLELGLREGRATAAKLQGNG